MIRIFIKEFNGFLNSLIAYIVIGVFLTAMGLLIWVFPDTSVLDYGYADLDTLFSIGPYVFIFLVPAITMKSLAEERKMGTLELLLTRPLTDFQILIGKWLASFTLVLVSLVPTGVYYFSVYTLGNPVGNVDTAGVMGSYLGLALLGGVFCAVGILASAITTNQIVAFILGAFGCFILYSGMESVSTLAHAGEQALGLKQLGILYHYESMSKGLIDSRDVIYFVSVIGLMMILSAMVLGSRQWQGDPSDSMLAGIRKGKQTGDWLWLANSLVVVVLINLIASQFFFRLDLTEEKRYTIKEPTKKLLTSLEEDVYIEVFLDGDLNAQFRRFRKSIQETLGEFKVYSRNKVHFTFTNPLQALSEKARNEYMAELASRGVQGMRVIDSKDGERIEKIIFPGAIVSANGFERGVMLLKGNRTGGSQEAINQSIEGTEFELANAIEKVSAISRKRVGWITGHGELGGLAVAGLNNALLEQYDVFRVDLPSKKSIPDYDALIIVKPTRSFSEQDKFKLDQFIMRGGKVLFLLDVLDAVMDSASQENYYAFPYDLKLEDQLFRYGVRINQNLVQDRVAGKYPVVVGEVDSRPEIMQLEWPFFPLVNQYAPHPVTRNLDATLTRFVSSIDTVKAAGVKKTPLMFTSPYSRRINSPVKIDINELRKKPSPELFNEGPLPVAYLLEGSFTSLYKSRFLPAGLDSLKAVDKSKPAKIIVVADGDVARNDVNPRNNQAQPLGYDPIAGYTFANQDLLMNMMSFLTGEDGLINARNKEVKIRPLDRERIKQERVYWQTLNVLMPMLLLVLFGITKASWRKRKYTHFA